jgi:hypothetical protein
MSHCTACQYTPAQGARFCPLCGAALPSETAEVTWQKAHGVVDALTVTAWVACEHCAAAVPVNGPTSRVCCGRCHQETRLEDLGDLLARTSLDGKVLGGRLAIHSHPDQLGPSCHGCGAEIPLGDSATFFGVVAVFPCRWCGTPVSTFPAPDWLRAQFPSALQIFGADPEITARETGHALAVATQAIQPISMTCGGCQAILTLTTISGRTVRCHHCHTSVLIPDELWLRLHPAVQMRRWTMTYLSTQFSTAPSFGTVRPEALRVRILRDGAVLREQIVDSTLDVKIGRLPSCQIRLDGDAIGRIHAIVEVSCSGELSIVDLGLPSGTRLNGQPVVTSTLLHIGDQIAVGDTTLEIGIPD